MKNDERKRQYYIYISLACFLIVCLSAITFFCRSDSEEKNYAESVKDLEVEISYETANESIRLWDSGNGVYYCFLPSGAQNRKISFSNVPPKAELQMDKKNIKEGYDLNKCDNLLTDTHKLAFSSNGEVEEVDLIFASSKNVPAMFINLDSADINFLSESKENSDSAHISIYENDTRVLSEKIEKIRCRGASSFRRIDKKSYAIKFEKYEKVLGMKSAKKWCLIANRLDGSFMHNKLAYDYFREYTDIYSPESAYVDLYLNGEYLGNYLLCNNVVDLLEIDKSYDLEEKNKSVNTKGQIKNAVIKEEGTISGYDGITDPNDITGTYIIEAKKEWDIFDVGFTSDYGNVYEVICPEHPSLNQVKYICGYVNEFEKALYSEDGINPDTNKAYSDYIDIDSWSKKYITDQLFGDLDKNSNYKSIFFYKFPDSVDKRMYSGLAWDYDCAFGEWSQYTYFDSPEFPLMTNTYSKVMVNKEDVKRSIKDNYSRMIPDFLQKDISDRITQLSGELRESAGMDNIRWSSTARYSTIDAEGDYIIWYLRQRAEVLEDIWCNDEVYHTVTFLGASGEVVDTYMVKHGEKLERVPIVSSWIGVFEGWKYKGKGEFYIGMPVNEDMIIESKWIRINTIVTNDFDDDLSDVNVDSLKKIENSIKKLQNK